MAHIAIPASIEGARKELEGIESLLTAKGWERAAIVYAFTEPQQGKRTSTNSRGGPMTIQAFSDLGINGLKTIDSVRKYRNEWEQAVKRGETKESAPGMKVKLPDRDFPPTRTGTNGVSTPEGARKRVQEMTPDAKKAAADELLKDEENVTPEDIGKSVSERSDSLVVETQVTETREKKTKKAESKAKKKKKDPDDEYVRIDRWLSKGQRELRRVLEEGPYELSAEGIELILADVQELRGMLDYIELMIQGKTTIDDTGLAALLEG